MQTDEIYSKPQNDAQIKNLQREIDVLQGAVMDRDQEIEILKA